MYFVSCFGIIQMLWLLDPATIEFNGYWGWVRVLVMEYMLGVYFIGLPFVFFVSDHLHSAAWEDFMWWGTR